MLNVFKQNDEQKINQDLLTEGWGRLVVVVLVVIFWPAGCNGAPE